MTNIGPPPIAPVPALPAPGGPPITAPNLLPCVVPFPALPTAGALLPAVTAKSLLLFLLPRPLAASAASCCRLRTASPLARISSAVNAMPRRPLVAADANDGVAEDAREAILPTLGEVGVGVTEPTRSPAREFDARSCWRELRERMRVACGEDPIVIGT